MTGSGTAGTAYATLALVSRRHVDLQRVSSAACQG
ncbi:MAG TPA: putative leader peptide [Angustibacter sp.]|nr:putative leader peptide [Angustibacter sp.]